MKGKYVLVLSTIILVSSIFHAGFNVFADKGRRHYEQTGEVVWDIKTEEKIVALTFDDGPHRKYTAEVLDLLGNYDAKATFFIIGENAEKYPELVLRVHDEGHEIANHTYTHPLKTTITKLEKELKQTNETIYSITGSYPKLFRPVGGQYTDDMIKLAVDKGYTVVMWSWHQDTEDWKNPGVKKIVNKVLNVTKQGDIILFHDGGGNRKQTVKALEEILPELQKQGYKFVTISELIEYKNNK